MSVVVIDVFFFFFHPALVTRCLQAIILLVPDMKIHFHKRLSSKQRVLLDQFDVVTSDLSNHCREINSKVMGIMDDMISKNLSTVSYSVIVCELSVYCCYGDLG